MSKSEVTGKYGKLLGHTAVTVGEVIIYDWVFDPSASVNHAETGLLAVGPRESLLAVLLHELHHAWDPRRYEAMTFLEKIQYEYFADFNAIGFNQEWEAIERKDVCGGVFGY